MPLEVIRARTEDWAAYALLRLRSLRNEPDAYGSAYAREAGFGPDIWQQRIAGSPTLLAYADGLAAPVGTATGLLQNNGEMMVVAMYVAPEARRTGCAHAMLGRLGELARETGQTRLILHVLDANVAAYGCYTAYGFTATGRRFALPRDPSRVEIELAYPL